LRSKHASDQGYCACAFQDIALRARFLEDLSEGESFHSSFSVIVCRRFDCDMGRYIAFVVRLDLQESFLSLRQRWAQSQEYIE
jgi:hypothetical protein